MSTRERVLEALRAAGDAGVSGETLAKELGVSRAAIAKHVGALQAAGYEIAAAPGRGYRLLGAPDLPIPEEVAPLLREPLWVRVEGGEETGSTNDDARALARAGAPEGTAVVAARQTAGRGRLGRRWSSPPGGAYLSAVLRPGVAPADASTLALAVGIGVARAIESMGGSPELKWPNDVLLAGGKVAGILLEMAAESDRVEWTVAGVGLNVRRPQDAQEGASYLSDIAPGVRTAVAAAAVLDEIAKAYGEWTRLGFAGLRDEYERRHSLGGKRVTVRDAMGVIRAEGDVRGIDEDGRLIVAGADGGERRIAAGEVTLRG